MKKDIRECDFRSIVGWRGDSLCCPQAFGGDIFQGCNLGCSWFCFCREMERELFTKYYDGWTPDLVRVADPDDYKRLFDRAFGACKPTDDWNIRCLRYGLPLNMGSKSEPFLQPQEPKVVKILELFREYKVPVIFETKTVAAGQEQFLDILKGLKCAVIVAIMGGTDTLNYQLEPGLPPASQRWAFVKELNKRGIWCGVRWEPILYGINSKNEFLLGYAKNAAANNARHVSLYNYRSSNYRWAQQEFEARGYNYLRLLEGNTDEKWKPIGKKFFHMLRDAGVKASSPDFINFPFDSDCVSCCGTDELFKPYLFNFQYACRRIRDHGRVSWEDMEAIEFRNEEAYQNMKANWNGGGGFFTLRDSLEIKVLEYDRDGRAVYGRAGVEEGDTGVDGFDF